jgi:hypothetical protein
MTTLQLEHLIPVYPDIPGTDSTYIDRYEFNKSIYTKEEFYDNRVAEGAPILIPGSGDKYPQQQFLANFLSPYTPYKNMLVFHAMGQGKTCASIAVAEANKLNYYTKPTLVLVKGKGGVQTFKNAIVDECNPRSEYNIYDNLDEEEEGENNKFKLSENKKAELTNKVIKPFYELDHIQSFVNKIEKSKQAAEYYSDRVIIIDEIQNIRIKPENGAKEPQYIDKVQFAKMYKTLYKFLHSVRNVKILLLSGTPVKDQPHEIASVMNLIIPIEDKLFTDKEFNKYYLTNDGSELNENGVKALTNAFTGRVSFLKRNENVNLEIRNMGEYIPGLTKFKLFTCEMGSIQRSGYLHAYNADKSTQDDKKGPGFQAKSEQALLFTYPDGSYGSKGASKYTNYSISTGSLTYKNNETDGGLNRYFNSGDVSYKEKLKRLRKLSCKYADIIEIMLEMNDEIPSMYTPDMKNNLLQAQIDNNEPHRDTEIHELVFIFNNLKRDGGGVLLGHLLKEFGFKKISIKKHNRPPTTSNKGECGNNPKNSKPLMSDLFNINFTPYKTYALINGDTTPTQQKINKIIQVYNSPENKFGYYIRGIIGSGVIAEGISLFNVTSIHIATPHWNSVLVYNEKQYMY